MSKFTDDLYKASKDPFNHPVESMILMELMEPEPTRKDLINKYGDAYLEWETENDHFRQAPNTRTRIEKKFPDGTYRNYYPKNKSHFVPGEYTEVDEKWKKDLSKWHKKQKWEHVKMGFFILWCLLITLGPIGILLYVIFNQ